MTILILAGGLGTRLRRVINDVPKVMAPLSDGKPFLEYLLRYAKKNDADKIILSVGYKSKIIKDYFGSQYVYTEELRPLGTAGAIKNAEADIGSDEQDFIVINGDTFFGINLKDFIRQARRSEAKIAMALSTRKNTERYSRIIIDKNNEMLSSQRNIQGPGLIGGGIFYFRTEMLKYFPKKGSLETDVINKFIGKESVYGFSYSDFFIDIGIPEDYEICKSYLPIYWKRF